MLANSVAIPILLGPLLGLNQSETAEFIQKIFIISGVFSIIQLYFGHRLTINEGCGSMWLGLYIVMASMAPLLGLEKFELLSALGLSVFAGGAITVVLGSFGLIGKIRPLFTPAVTGTFSMLLAFQLTILFLQGMLGLLSGYDSVNLPHLIIALIVLAVVVGITLYGKGALKTIGMLIGIMIGWLLHIMFGLIDTYPTHGNISLFPKLTPWMRFEWNISVIVTGMITGILVVSNMITAIVLLSRLNNKEPQASDFNRSAIVTGFSSMAGGYYGTPGYAPFMAAASLVSLTNVKDKLPFILGSLLMVMMGLVTPISNFIATLPISVAGAALLGAASQIFAAGLRDFQLLAMDNRTIFVIGLSVLIGVGVFSLPNSAFQQWPFLLKMILGNGMMAGLLIAILLEHVFIREKKTLQHIEKTKDISS